MFFFTCLFLMVFFVCTALAQRVGRVYADSQTSGYTCTTVVLCGSVSNASHAVHPDNSLYTTLTAIILGDAWQNLRFMGTTKPTSSTPIIVNLKGPSGTLLDLTSSILTNIEIVKTHGGPNTIRGSLYSGGLLLFLGTPARETLIAAEAASGHVYDGVKVRLFGLASSIRLHHAFFIVSPDVEPVSICSGNSATLTITNAGTHGRFQYRLFESLTSTTPLASTSDTTLVTPRLSNTVTYYVEALEDNHYPSGRTAVTVTVLPVPNTPDTSLY